MRPEGNALRLRLGVIAGFLVPLGLLAVREYVVNVRPHTVQWAAEQHLLGYWQAYGAIGGLLAVVFPVAVLLCATAGPREWETRWRAGWTAGVLLGVWIALCGCMMLWTNRQFGAFDESIVVDTLWRQHLGQVAYRDFGTTNPPLFVLGLRLAGWMFGANWKAQGWLLCGFSGVTLPWTFALLRRLELTRAQSLLLTVVTQVSGLAVLSFWWFNGTTAVVSGLFLLSAVLLLRREDSRFAWGSLVLSLALLTWVKANSAGLMGVLLAGVLLLFVQHRGRVAGLVGAGLALSCGALLVCGISPAWVVRSYAGVARSRGLTFLAFKINPFFTAEIYFELLCLVAVMTAVVPALWRAVRGRDRVAVGSWLLLLLGAGVGVFALASNGDLADVALTPVLLAVGVAAYGGGVRARWVPVFYTGLFCALLCTGVYKAESRLRVRLTGPYFADSTESGPVQGQFFKGLRTGKAMNDVARTLDMALREEPGPVFFTSRLEWAYAEFGLTPPTGLPVFYQAGTSYAPAEEAKLLERWKGLHFATVIQPGRLPIGIEDWVFFPGAFQQELAAGYTRDATTYPGIVVWRRRAERTCGF